MSTPAVARTTTAVRDGVRDAHTSKLLTPDDLAARWSVNKSHVYRLTREGRVPFVPVGRYYRYRLDAIEQWERDGGAGL
jgi:excisionase family DNA binding protein